MNIYSREYYDRYKNFDDSRLTSFITKNIASVFCLSESWKVDLTVDIGCGRGRLLDGLASRAKRSIGVDISKAGIWTGQERSKKVFFITGDALRLPVRDDTCDLCLCVHVIEHVEEYNLLLKEIFRIMRSGGRAVFITPNRKWSRFGLSFLKDKTHVKEFTVRELKIALSGYFCIKDIRSFSMFTSFGILNPALNMLIKPDICAFVTKR